MALASAVGRERVLGAISRTMGQGASHVWYLEDGVAEPGSGYGKGVGLSLKGPLHIQGQSEGFTQTRHRAVHGLRKSNELEERTRGCCLEADWIEWFDLTEILSRLRIPRSDYSGVSRRCKLWTFLSY